MIGAADDHQLVAGVGRLHQVRAGQRALDEGDVKLAGEQRPLDVAGVLHAHRHAHLRMCTEVVGEHQGERVVGDAEGGAEAELAADAGADRRRLALEERALLDDGAGALEDDLARLGEPPSRGTAVEERQSQSPLQPGDLNGHARLAEVEPLGGGAEAVRLGDGAEGAQLGDRDVDVTPSARRP